VEPAAGATGAVLSGAGTWLKCVTVGVFPFKQGRGTSFAGAQAQWPRRGNGYSATVKSTWCQKSGHFHIAEPDGMRRGY
jgi:hypothetical protein